MTNAENITIIAGEGAGLVALTEERFGPLPQREPGNAGGRARAVAGIHALADFLLEHPDIPTPYAVHVYCTVPHTLMLEQLGEHFGVEPWRPEGVAKQIALRAVEPSAYAILVSVKPEDRPL